MDRMISKEEIEKAYWAGYAHREAKAHKICEECVYRNKYKQLENKQQKVIEKLEEDIEQSCCDGKYKGNFRKARWQDEYAQEILEFIKGEE